LATEHLTKEVDEALAALSELETHRDQIDGETITEIQDTLKELGSRRSRQEVFVAVVGEQKAGKSTLLNAILGLELLGTAVRECTGTITFMRRAERPGYRAIFQSGQSEDFNSLFLDEHVRFSQEVSAHDEFIKRCDEQSQSLPADIHRLDESIRQLEASLESLKHQAHSAGAMATDQRNDDGRMRQLVAQREQDLQAVAGQVPWAYHRAGGWPATFHILGRLFLKFWEKPEWVAHLSWVEEFENQQRQAATSAMNAHSATEAAEAWKRSVIEEQHKLDKTRKQRQTADQSLADLPAQRAHRAAQRDQELAAWSTHREERLARFAQEVKQLTDMNRRGKDVEELHLFLPSDRVPVDVVLIDTPGVNTANDENRNRAWKAIKNHADACVLIADLAQPLSESTREFVRQVRDVTPHILLVLTKLDAVLRNADLTGGNAEQEVAEAIDVARQRFAREVGRAESEILTFAVAARPALKQNTGPSVEAFDAELKRIFSVVEAERSIAVSAKCARAIRNVHRATSARVSEAEQRYRHRIDTLMAQRVDNPVHMRNQGVVALVPQIRASARDVSEYLRQTLTGQLAAYRAGVIETVESSANSQQLAVAVDQFQSTVTQELDAISAGCQLGVDERFSAPIEALVDQARQPLWERYRISESVAEAPPARPPLPIPIVSATTRLSLTAVGAEVSKQVKSHIKGNASLAAGVGRGVATAKSPLMLAATLAAGAAFAALNARKFTGLKEKCVAKVDELLSEVVAEATSESMIGAAAIEQQLGCQLNGILDADILAFQDWIQALIHSEQQALTHQQQSLGHLNHLQARLVQHDGRLSQSLEQATTVCAGLSRSLDAAGA